MIELELVAVVPDDELDWYELVIPADVARAIAFDRDASMIIEGSDSGALLSAIRWLVR